MNKLITTIIAAVLALSLAACGTPSAPAKLTIDKATLTQQEQDIVKLVGGNTSAHIYDFTLDNNVKSLQVNTYKLVNSSWDIISGGGGQQFTDTKGRLALGFDNIHDGLRTALQSDKNGGSSSYASDTTEDFAGMGTLTNALDTPTKVVYEQEIPLVIQISTAANTVVSGDLDSFFAPDVLAAKGYEHVYAITIRFSTKTPSELAG